MKPAKLVLLSDISENPYAHYDPNSKVFCNIIARELRELRKNSRIVLIIDSAYAFSGTDACVTGRLWPGGLRALDYADRAILRTVGLKETVLKDRGKV